MWEEIRPAIQWLADPAFWAIMGFSALFVYLKDVSEKVSKISDQVQELSRSMVEAQDVRDIRKEVSEIKEGVDYMWTYRVGFGECLYASKNQNEDQGRSMNGMIRWEYHHIPHVLMGSAGITDQLNKLGEEGWELVPPNFFKRPYKICSVCWELGGEEKVVLGSACEVCGALADGTRPESGGQLYG